MSTILTYKYKLYKSKHNKHLHQQIDSAGIIWNHCIALHKRYYRLFGKSLNKYQLKKHITKLKKQPRYSFWNQLGSQAIQDIVFRLDKGYKLFFRNLKAGMKSAPPSFKKVKKYKSFTLSQAGWSVCGNSLRIGKRIYKFFQSRNLDSKVKTVTIKRNALGELFVCFAIAVANYPHIKLTSGKAAGFDFGLKTFLTTSDEEEIKSPLFLKQSLRQLARLQRKFAGTKQGSSRWRTLKRQIASLHETIVNRRRDWFYKLAHDLTDAYDYLFFETLNLKGMQRLWGRKVNDLALGTFLQILEHVANKKGKIVHCIDRWYPSTKLCGCGYKHDALTLDDRRWRCPSCQRVNDRDENAAKNILCEGASSQFAEVV